MIRICKFTGIRAALLLLVSCLATHSATGTMVYVAEFNTNKVLQYEVTGTTWTATGVELSGTYGGGALTSPGALAFGNGKLYVAETANSTTNRILEFDAGGGFQRVVATVGPRPDKMVIAADGYLYYTTPFASITPDAVIRLDIAWGTTSTFIPMMGTGYTLNNPRGIAVDGDGNFYLADRNSGGGSFSGNVRKFNSAGAFLGNVANVDSVTGMAYDADNNRLLFSGGLSIDSFNDMDILTSGTGTPSTATRYYDGSLSNIQGIMPLDGNVYWVTQDGKVEYRTGASAKTTVVSGLGVLYDVVAVPEPTSIALVLLGIGVGLLRRRRRAQRN